MQPMIWYIYINCKHIVTYSLRYTESTHSADNNSKKKKILTDDDEEDKQIIFAKSKKNKTDYTEKSNV